VTKEVLDACGPTTNAVGEIKEVQHTTNPRNKQQELRYSGVKTNNIWPHLHDDPKQIVYVHVPLDVVSHNQRKAQIKVCQ
jgi:hypothetical protein